MKIRKYPKEQFKGKRERKGFSRPDPLEVASDLSAGKGAGEGEGVTFREH